MSIDLEKRLSDTSKGLPWRPLLFDLSKERDRHRLEALFEQGAVRHVRNDIEEQLREYHAFLNPSLALRPGLEADYQKFRSDLESEAPLWQQGIWVFYPWRSALVHVLDEERFRQVRTSRNRDLIPEKEQRLFSEAVIGVAGLSVGNSIALAVVIEGGSDRIRLADFDRFSLSNINRVRASTFDFGSNKAEMTARQIFEINPYASVEVFGEGLSERNIDQFLDGLDAVVDEVDNIAVKCLIRERAKRARIPVLMATDNGDNAVIDIERYDLDPGTPLFHGRMGNVSYEKLLRLDKIGIGRLAVKYVGPDITPPRLRSSMLKIGKTLVSWPQLGGAALMNGSIAAYCLRAITAGLPLKDGRAVFDLDEKFIPGYMAPHARRERDRQARTFARDLGL